MVKRMVRWLMQVRKNGRWGNTQENAWAMASLVDYYRKYESEVPDFVAVVTMGAEALAREEFRGRSTEAKTKDVPMNEVQKKGPAGSKLPLLFDRQGTGTLFYLVRLRYAVSGELKAFDNGFSVTRAYTLHDDSQAITTFKAGDLIRVVLQIRNTKERRFVAVVTIPDGTEPVDRRPTTRSKLVRSSAGKTRPGIGGSAEASITSSGTTIVSMHSR